MAKVSKQVVTAPKTDAQMIQEAVAAGKVQKVGTSVKVATGSSSKKTGVKLVSKSKPAPAPKADKKAEAEKKARFAALRAASAERKEEQAAERAENRKKAEADWESGITRQVPCACGCGVGVDIKRFKPGHDAQLFSRLLKGEPMPKDADLTDGWTARSKS